MKLIKMMCLTLFVSVIAVACKEKANSEHKEKVITQKVVDLQKVSIGIEGMTCQIGCAKTIESKLSKTEGVTSAKVSFEEKNGEFVFDANQISKEDIVAKITAIGNGETYTTTEVKELAL